MDLNLHRDNIFVDSLDDVNSGNANISDFDNEMNSKIAVCK